MAKPVRPGPGLDDYLYWQERLANRERARQKTREDWRLVDLVGLPPFFNKSVF